MATSRRPLQDGEIRITQSHLAALSVVFVSIASLTFLLGMQVGKLGGVEVEVEARAPFTPAPLAEDRLEAMLREVELARAVLAPANDADLRFPEALTGAAAVSPVAVTSGTDDGSSDTVTAQPLADARPAAPTTLGGDVPTSGWSIQVSTMRDIETARRHRDDLSRPVGRVCGQLVCGRTVLVPSPCGRFRRCGRSRPYAQRSAGAGTRHLLHGGPMTEPQHAWTGLRRIWARTCRYVGKLLFVRQGHRLSLQHHEARSRPPADVGADRGCAWHIPGFA